MQHSNQLSNLVDSLNGQPLAVHPGYWQTIASEINTLAGSITTTDISQRRTAVAARLQGSSAPANLNSAAATPKGSIAHLQLSGLMLSQDYLWYRGVNHLTAELTAADGNPNIKGVLLEVNSGGGMVTAGQMLAATIGSMSKPVVVFTHFMASAAIMGTLPANRIIASSQGAEIGSIGTLVQVDKLMADYNKKRYHSIYADRSTRKNESYRAAQNQDYGLLASKVNQINDLFVSEVRKHRPLKGDTSATLSGAMFMATEAYNKGLIDGIGGLPLALGYLANAVKFGERPRKSTPVSSTSTAAKQPSYMNSPINREVAAMIAARGPKTREQRLADRLAGRK